MLQSLPQPGAAHPDATSWLQHVDGSGPVKGGMVTEMGTAASVNGTGKAQRQHFVRTTVVLVGRPVAQVMQQTADW